MGGLRHIGLRIFPRCPDAGVLGLTADEKATFAPLGPGRDRGCRPAA